MPEFTISDKVAESTRKARENFSSLTSMFKGLEGTGIEAEGGALGPSAKAFLFEGTSIVDRIEEITDLLSAYSAQASVATSVLRFVPGMGKLNTFINLVADPLLKAGDGSAKLLQNIRDAFSSAKDNVVDSLQNSISDNRELLDNDSGFDDLDEVEQRLALELLLEQEESEIKRMLGSLDDTESTIDAGGSSALNAVMKAAMHARTMTLDPAHSMSQVPGMG